MYGIDEAIRQAALESYDDTATWNNVDALVALFHKYLDPVLTVEFELPVKVLEFHQPITREIWEVPCCDTHLAVEFINRVARNK